MQDAGEEGRWLVLIHQIPPKPDYFRVKIWRRLHKIGAVAVKNSVYVLPKTEQAQEDFHWLVSEIVGGGGEAMLCEARFVEGLTDGQIEDLFRSVRASEYQQIAEEARRLAKSLPRSPPEGEEGRSQLQGAVERLKVRLAEVATIDFFGAPGEEPARGLLAELEARIHTIHRAADKPARALRHEFQGRTWVTRKGIYVDRMASAWLIQRFIDPQACFKFVPAKGYAPTPGELRFDMFEAEFTHEGDRCTFEVLAQHFGLADPALRVIGEIVHDIDLKDSKFRRQQTPGIELLIAAIAMAHKDDESRLNRASAVFDDLYEYFKRKRS